jgi:hypothetical protein
MRAKRPAGLRGRDARPDSTEKLYERMLQWLYERQDVRRALPVARRLETLLEGYSRKPESIFLEACRSLVCESKGDLKGGDQAPRERDSPDSPLTHDFSGDRE